MTGRSLALVLAAVAAGCGDSDVRFSGSCAELIEWKGARYLGTAARLPVRPGGRLARATRLGCDGDDDPVDVVRVRGVPTELALGAATMPTTVYVRDGALDEGRALPAALELALYGPRCANGRPFTVEGVFGGTSNLDEPASVSIEVDTAPASARRYLGLPIALLLRPSTRGLNRRDALVPRVGERMRLRARVRCVAGDRPTETFLAEEVARAPRTPPIRDPGRLACAPAGRRIACGGPIVLGTAYPYDFSTACGLRDAYFGGRWWRLAGGPIERADMRPAFVRRRFQRGVMRLLSRASAEFAGGGMKLGLVPAGPRYRHEPCG